METGDDREAVFVCVLGPRGVGKTTLLQRLLAVTPVRVIDRHEIQAVRLTP